MNSKLLSLAAVAALAIGFASSGAHAQSAKFAAAWDNDVVNAKAGITSVSKEAGECTYGDFDVATGTCSAMASTVLMATIDVPQQKDLLIGVSAQIGLVTLTQAKGKNTDPSLGSALASAGVDVTLELREAGTNNVVQIAAPGPVTFASRLQELKVDVNDLDGSLTEVTVSLMLDTTAAHHFNFIGVDLNQGNYDVVAVFDLSAFVAILGEDAIAEAEVIVGPRMVTAQEVRAAKGALVAFD